MVLAKEHSDKIITDAPVAEASTTLTIADEIAALWLNERLSSKGSWPHGIWTQICRPWVPAIELPSIVELSPYGYSLGSIVFQEALRPWFKPSMGQYYPLVDACLLMVDASELHPAEMSSISEISSTEYLQPVLNRLEGFASLPADWDSYGAEPISPHAIYLARRFMHAVAEQFSDLARERVRPYAVAPLVDGGVQIEWRGPGGDIEVEIGPDGALGYLLIRDDGSTRMFEERDNVSWSEMLDLVAKVLIH